MIHTKLYPHDSAAERGRAMKRVRLRLAALLLLAVAGTAFLSAHCQGPRRDAPHDGAAIAPSASRHTPAPPPAIQVPDW
jgi:hypothetical protein